MEEKKRKRDGDPPRITFYTSDRTFERLLKEKTLGAVRDVARKKLGLNSDANIHLVQMRNGKTIVLDDEDDFEAFLSFALSNGSAEVQLTVAGHTQAATKKTPKVTNEENEATTPDIPEGPKRKKQKVVHDSEAQTSAVPPPPTEQTTKSKKAKKPKDIVPDETQQAIEPRNPTAVTLTQDLTINGDDTQGKHQKRRKKQPINHQDASQKSQATATSTAPLPPPPQAGTSSVDTPAAPSKASTVKRKRAQSISASTQQTAISVPPTDPTPSQQLTTKRNRSTSVSATKPTADFAAALKNRKAPVVGVSRSFLNGKTIDAERDVVTSGNLSLGMGAITAALPDQAVNGTVEPPTKSSNSNKRSETDEVDNNGITISKSKKKKSQKSVPKQDNLEVNAVGSAGPSSNGLNSPAPETSLHDDDFLQSLIQRKSAEGILSRFMQQRNKPESKAAAQVNKTAKVGIPASDKLKPSKTPQPSKKKRQASSGESLDTVQENISSVRPVPGETSVVDERNVSSAARNDGQSDKSDESPATISQEPQKLDPGCLVCRTTNSHELNQCSIVTSGRDSVQKRIKELQKEDKLRHKQLIQQLKAQLNAKVTPKNDDLVSKASNKDTLSASETLQPANPTNKFTSLPPVASATPKHAPVDSAKLADQPASLSSPIPHTIPLGARLSEVVVESRDEGSSTESESESESEEESDSDETPAAPLGQSALSNPVPDGVLSGIDIDALMRGPYKPITKDDLVSSPSGDESGAESESVTEEEDDEEKEERRSGHTALGATRPNLVTREISPSSSSSSGEDKDPDTTIRNFRNFRSVVVKDGLPLEDHTEDIQMQIDNPGTVSSTPLVTSDPLPTFHDVSQRGESVVVEADGDNAVDRANEEDNSIENAVMKWIEEETRDSNKGVSDSETIQVPDSDVNPEKLHLNAALEGLQTDIVMTDSNVPSTTETLTNSGLLQSKELPETVLTSESMIEEDHVSRPGTPSPEQAAQVGKASRLSTPGTITRMRDRSGRATLLPLHESPPSPSTRIAMTSVLKPRVVSSNPFRQVAEKLQEVRDDKSDTPLDTPFDMILDSVVARRTRASTRKSVIPQLPPAMPSPAPARVTRRRETLAAGDLDASKSEPRRSARRTKQTETLSEEPEAAIPKGRGRIQKTKTAESKAPTGRVTRGQAKKTTSPEEEKEEVDTSKRIVGGSKDAHLATAPASSLRNMWATLPEPSHSGHSDDAASRSEMEQDRLEVDELISEGALPIITAELERTQSVDNLKPGLVLVPESSQIPNAQEASSEELEDHDPTTSTMAPPMDTRISPIGSSDEEWNANLSTNDKGIFGKVPLSSLRPPRLPRSSLSRDTRRPRTSTPFLRSLTDIVKQHDLFPLSRPLTLKRQPADRENKTARSSPTRDNDREDDDDDEESSSSSSGESQAGNDGIKRAKSIIPKDKRAGSAVARTKKRTSLFSFV